MKQVIDNGPVATPTTFPSRRRPSDRSRRPQGAQPHVDHHAEQRREARRAQTDQARLGAGSSTRAREGQGGQTFRAGDLNSKKLVGKLERAARKKARPTRPAAQPAARRRSTTRPTRSRTPGPAPIGVPNFFIDKFRIPPFLLPIYQAAGIQYGVRWEVLAAINEIETDYGRNLNVSSAGALGWMQFMPATWKQYGVDANQDGRRIRTTRSTRSSPPRATCKAAGAEQDLRRAIFAYNHADWYVDSVLLRARVIGGLPTDLVGSLTGLTQGRFPVAAKATYADDISERDAKKLAKRARNKAVPSSSRQAPPRHQDLRQARRPGVAVNDGKIVRRRQEQAPRPLRQAPGRLRQHLHVRAPEPGRQDATRRPSAQKSPRRRSQRELELPAKDAAPTARRLGRQGPRRARPKPAPSSRPPAAPPTKPARRSAAATAEAAKERLFANPRRPQRRRRRRRPAGVRAHGQDRRRRRPSRATSRRVFGLDRTTSASSRSSGSTRHRRHDPRPHRQTVAALRAAHAVRDPPGRPRRPAHRPEADPRRLEAARVDRDLPRRGQEPVLRPATPTPRRSARSC